MTTELAIDYIPRRMKELGYGDNYYIRFRHLILRDGEAIKIDAYNQLFFVVEAHPAIRIISDLGFYDMGDLSANELSYEHQGEIEIKGTSPGKETVHVKLLQVIPKNIKTK